MLYEGTRQYISGLTDKQLLEYLVTGTEEYDADAVQFAKDELQRRKLNDEQVEDLTAEAIKSLDEKEWATEERAAMPLGKAGKLLWFALGSLNVFAIGLAIFVWIYADRGNSRKARQMFYGLCCGAVVEILLYYQYETGLWVGPLSTLAGLISAGYLFYVAKTRPQKKTAGFEVIQLPSQQKNSSN